MSKKNWSSILSGLTRTTLAFALVFGQTAWAMQGQNAKDKPGSGTAAKPRQAPPNPAMAAGAKAQTAEEDTAREETPPAEENTHSRGQHEGIKVHGHWTIEVRDPDGILARHVEFENSLAPGFSTTNSGGQVVVVPGGAAFLSAVASGQWNFASSGWEVLFVGPSGLTKILTATDAPCIPACVIGTPTTFGSCPTGVSSTPGTSCNLSIAALGTSPAFTGFQLSGSVAATQMGQVSTVLTTITVTCPASTPNCLSAGTNGAAFTSSTNFPGSPITVAAGQTIAVTVTISFS
jgi:hypothetical protein